MAFNVDFDAPMFCDFENLDQDDTSDDFFDTRTDDGLIVQDDSKLSTSTTTKLTPRRRAKSSDIVSPVPLKPLNRQNLSSASDNTNVDHLRPKTSAASSLGTINKSSATTKHITKEQAARMVQRLCPSDSKILNKTKFVSMAEETKKYFGTPERFRRAPRSRASSADRHLTGAIHRRRSPSPSVRRIMMPTMPQSPKLLTRGRTRCNHHPSEDEALEAKKASALARLVSLKRKVTSSLSSQQQQVKHTATSKMREEKAKSAGVVPLKQPLKSVLHNGIPILLHNKIHKNEAAKDEKKPLPPVPANSVHFKLYEQDKEIRAKLEREREKELERERQLALFTAKEPTVLNKKPFLPKQCDKDPVKPIDSHLRTELRSETRKQFDQRMKEKEAELEAAKQQEMERRERQEMMELMKERSHRVIKAAPIRAYAPVNVKPSEKPITQPKTPNFRLNRTRHKSS